MALITVTDVHLAYEDRRLLRGVSLSIDDGERIGLLGPNGSGKSSLLAIIAGVKEPDRGERIVRRDLRIGLLEQEPGLDPSLPVRDAVRLGFEGRAEVVAAMEKVHAAIADPTLTPARVETLLARQAELEDRLEHLGGQDVEHRVEAMVRSLGLRDPDARCGLLSGGERRRVALARLLLSAPDLLLLDEPTNHLDAIVTDWLEDWLLDSASGVPLLMVTHDRYFLDRIVSRIVELDRGQLYSYDGNYTDYLTARAERDEVERHLTQVHRQTLRRETAWIRRGPPAQRKKSKARLAQYAKLAEGKPEAVGGTLEFEIPPGPRLGTRVIRLHGAMKAFAGRVVVPPVDLEIGPGERIGIVGPNGAGKTTFLGLCTGRVSPDSGEVLIAETVRFAIIDQQRSELDPAKTVLEEVAGKNAFVAVGERLVRVETFLEQFLFPGERKHQLIGKLSGGERNRVLLAKLLSKGGNVLVLDEPTNDLDIATLRVLEEAILAFQGSVLVVSHDRWFLDRVATRIIALDGMGGLRVHEGALSLLLDRMQEERLAAEAAAKDAARARERREPSRPPAPSGPRLSASERKELAQLPDRIMAAESKLQAIDARLAEPSFYARPRDEQVEAAGERRAAAELVESLYRRWEFLEALAQRAPG